MKAIYPRFVLRYICVKAHNVHRNKKCSVFNICLFSERYDFCDFDIGRSSVSTNFIKHRTRFYWIIKRKPNTHVLILGTFITQVTTTVTTVAWNDWIDVTSRKTRVTFYRRPPGTVCFRRVSRREDNGETDKSSCILIVTFLLKLSSQWVKCALGGVYIASPIGEMKKKKKKGKFLSSFKLNSIGVGLGKESSNENID